MRREWQWKGSPSWLKHGMYKLCFEESKKSVNNGRVKLKRLRRVEMRELTARNLALKGESG